MIEKDIENYFVRQAKKIGALVWKLTSPSTSGVPDRLFIRNGKIIFVELKRPKEELRKLQGYRKKQLEDQGFLVVRINNKKSVDEFLVKMKEGEANDLYTT